MWALAAVWGNKFKGWIAAFAGFAVILVTVWFSSKRAGKAEAKTEAANQRADDREALAVRKVEETQAAAKVEVETIQEAQNVQVEVNQSSTADIAGKLRDNWTR
jgi:hypothetical protein